MPDRPVADPLVRRVALLAPALFAVVVRRLRVPLAAAVAASFCGVLPMLVHGHLIVFKGGRLF